MGALESLYGNALQGSYLQSGTSLGTIGNNLWTTAIGTTTNETNIWYDFATNKIAVGKNGPVRARALSSLPPNQTWLDERVNEMRVAL